MGELRALADEITEAFNAHDEERIRSFYADDAVFTGPGGVELKGPGAISGYAMAWLNAFPDATLTIHDRAVGDGWIAERFTFEGTHTETLSGPEGDIPATNRRLSGRGAELVRVENGKVVEDHLYFDQVDVMTQLGLMPETAGATT